MWILITVFAALIGFAAGWVCCLMFLSNNWDRVNARVDELKRGDADG